MSFPALGLASGVGLALKKQYNQAIPNDMKVHVQEFFLRPDISYTMPGTVDEMVIWDESGKESTEKVLPYLES